MHIVKLTADNFKRLSAVEITPDGALVEISGRNANGKSSVLDAIEAALGGDRPDRPIRAGEERAEVRLDLGELVVRRVYTTDGPGKLIVENKEGDSKKSPQAVLDALVGKLSFDPLAFGRMKPADQAALLRRLTGCDTAQLDAERARHYEARRKVGAVHDALKGQLAGIALPEPPAEEVGEEKSAKEVRERIKWAQRAAAERAEALANVTGRLQGLAPRRAGIAAAEAELATARAAPAKARAALEENAKLRGRLELLILAEQKAEERVHDLEALLATAREAHRLAARETSQQERLVEGLVDPDLTEIDAAPARIQAEIARERVAVDEEMRAIDAERARVAAMVTPDLAALEAELDALDEHNAAVRARRAVRDRHAAAVAAREAKAAEVKAEADRYDALTREIARVDEAKAALLAATTFPVPGLGIEGDAITFNAIPFSQASSAEQLRVGLAIGAALSPKLKVILIRDGNVLDSDGMALLAAFAEERGLQVWIERVDESGAVGVVIEDGRVVATNPRKKRAAKAVATGETLALDGEHKS